MKRSNRTLAAITTLALGLALGSGCGKKDSGGGKDGEKGGKQGKGHAMVLEEQTLQLGKLTVKVQVPKGWKKGGVGSSVMFSAPRGGMFSSWIRLSTTCEGACNAIPENIKKAGASALAQQQSAKVYKDLKVVTDEATAKGHRYRLDFVYQDKPGVQLSTYYYEKGADEAVQCTAMLLKRHAKHAGAFAKICDSLAITK